MYVSGNSKVGVNRNSVGFYLKLHLLKGTVGENCGVSGEVQFGGKDIPVV